MEEHLGSFLVVCAGGKAQSETSVTQLMWESTSQVFIIQECESRHGSVASFSRSVWHNDLVPFDFS